MKKAVRISASIPSELLGEFEELIKKRAYISRSKALSDAMRGFIASHYWAEESGEKLGVIAIVYDHTTRGTTEKVTEIQHSFHESIKSNMHLHLDEENCLEILTVKASAKKINELASKLQSLGA